MLLSFVRKTGGTGSTRLLPGLTLYLFGIRCTISFACSLSYSRLAHWFPNVNKHVIIVHSCVKRGGPVSVTAAGTITNGIGDHSKARQIRLHSRSRYRHRRIKNHSKPRQIRLHGRSRYRHSSRRWSYYRARPRKALPNHVSKLSAATDGYRPAIHGKLEVAGTVLAADPFSVRVSAFRSEGSLSDVRSIGRSAALGAEAARGLASNESASAIPECPVHFCRKVVVLDFDHNLIVSSVPTSQVNLIRLNFGNPRHLVSSI
jgi:hypothetical protein